LENHGYPCYQTGYNGDESFFLLLILLASREGIASIVWCIGATVAIIIARSGLLGLNNRKGPLELRNFGFAILVHVIALVVVLLQFFVLLAFLVSMTVRLSSLDI
jgi:hypothetical protein